MSLWADIVAAVDARVAGSSSANTRMGTVVSPYVPAIPSWGAVAQPAMVLLDGDTVAVPVKQMGGVIARDGDRVGCVRFGSDWWMVGSAGANRENERHVKWDSLSAGTINNLVGAQVPGTSSFRFYKERPDTYLSLFVSALAFASSGATFPIAAGFGVKMTGDPGTGIDTDFDVLKIQFGQINSYTTGASSRPVPWAAPAQEPWHHGWYTITPWWRRADAGSGSVEVSAASFMSLHIREHRPPIA